MLVALIPPPAEAAAGCPSAVTFYSVNWLTHAVNPMLTPQNFTRFASAASRAAQSCKTDPDMPATPRAPASRLLLEATVICCGQWAESMSWPCRTEWCRKI
jgi:hypothetical protein